MKKINRASKSQIIETYALLVRYCRKRADGMAEYVDDMTDAKIAEQVGAPASSVAALRRERFGDFRRGAKPADDVPDSDAINILIHGHRDLLKRVERVERALKIGAVEQGQTLLFDRDGCRVKAQQ